MRSQVAIIRRNCDESVDLSSVNGFGCFRENGTFLHCRCSSFIFIFILILFLVITNLCFVIRCKHAITFDSPRFLLLLLFLFHFSCPSIQHGNSQKSENISRSFDYGRTLFEYVAYCYCILSLICHALVMILVCNGYDTSRFTPPEKEKKTENSVNCIFADKEMNRVSSVALLLARRNPVAYRFTRNSSHSTTTLANPCIAVAPDSKHIVCYHPEKDHPYENTRPIDRTDSSFAQVRTEIKCLKHCTGYSLFDRQLVFSTSKCNKITMIDTTRNH
jgi:hypothetical protein